MSLIDVHAHFVTDAYVEAAKAGGHIHPDGMSRWPSWDSGTHLRAMDEWGVRTSMLSISSPGVHFGSGRHRAAIGTQVNEFGAGIARERPGRFGQFASPSAA